MKLKLNLDNRKAPKVGVEVFELLNILDAIIVTGKSKREIFRGIDRCSRAC